MDMIVNPQLIRTERLKRAWSQEHLAQVTGLGLRTVQRIESGGNASLETVKALAAVLGLPVEALLVKEPAPSLALPSRAPFSLFKPWRVFAAGSVATLITMGGFVSIQGALADQVEMDLAVRLNDEEVSRSRMGGEDDSPYVVEIAELLKISLTPSIRDKGLVFIKAEIYLFQEGELKLFASPAILSEDGKPSQIRVSQEDGTSVEIDLTSVIE